MSASGVTLSWGGARTILFQLLLPFAAGHLLRPLIGDWVTAHKRLVSVSDRGSILLVVYTAFSAAVVEGLWHRVAPAELLVLTVCCIRSEEHTSELQSLMRISYAVFCLKKKHT